MSGFANSASQLAKPQCQHLPETNRVNASCFQPGGIRGILNHVLCKYFISTRFACSGFKCDTKIQSKLQLKLLMFTSFLVQTIKNSWGSHCLFKEKSVFLPARINFISPLLGINMYFNL